MSTPSCKVTLLSHTKYIKETIYCVWKKSREPDYQYTPEQLHELSGGTFGQEIDELFTQVINTALPVAEQIQFVFWLDNVPISLREQIVRHRIGTKINGVPDVDVIPDLTDSTWWAQGMRVLDMGTFATDKNYYIPQSVIDKEAVEVYTSSMQVQEKIYQHLTELGIPREDARQVIPLGATHGMSWSLNLQAIKHIIGHRSCWILQIGMWRDLLLGMIQELVKIEPSFRSLINPPCMKEDTYVDCIYQVDNHRRMSGADEPPPCSLYLHNQPGAANHASKRWKYIPRQTQNECWGTTNDIARERYNHQKQQYAELWMRDPITGKKVQI